MLFNVAFPVGRKTLLKPEILYMSSIFLMHDLLVHPSVPVLEERW